MQQMGPMSKINFKPFLRDLASYVVLIIFKSSVNVSLLLTQNITFLVAFLLFFHCQNFNVNVKCQIFQIMCPVLQILPLQDLFQYRLCLSVFGLSVSLAHDLTMPVANDAMRTNSHWRCHYQF